MTRFPALAALLRSSRAPNPPVTASAADTVSVSQVPPALPCRRGATRRPGRHDLVPRERLRVGNAGRAPARRTRATRATTSSRSRRCNDERRVVIYDQLGAGKSDHVTDTTLFTIRALRRGARLPRAATSATRAGTCSATRGAPSSASSTTAPIPIGSRVSRSRARHSTCPPGKRTCRRMIATLSDSAQRAIKAREADGNFAAPDYQAANGEFMAQVRGARPPGPDLDSTLSSYNEAHLRSHVRPQRVHHHRNAQDLQRNRIPQGRAGAPALHRGRIRRSASADHPEAGCARPRRAGRRHSRLRPT